MKLIAADPQLDSKVSLTPSERSLFKGFTVGLGFGLFFIVIPGFFIFSFIVVTIREIGPGLVDIAFAVGVPAFLGLIYLIYWFATRKYASPDVFRKHLADEAAKHEARMKQLVAIGHATLQRDGQYVYTAAYYESERRHAAEFKSLSSGSSSSSSGGGSSGGGGASSSW